MTQCIVLQKGQGLPNIHEHGVGDKERLALEMKDSGLRPALGQQEVGQDQVKKQLPAGVVVDKIDARHPSRQQRRNPVRVVDKDVMPLLRSRGKASNLFPHGQIAQVDAVAGSATVTAGLNAVLGGNVTADAGTITVTAGNDIDQDGELSADVIGITSATGSLDSDGTLPAGLTAGSTMVIAACYGSYCAGRRTKTIRLTPAEQKSPDCTKPENADRAECKTPGPEEKKPADETKP